MKTDDALMYGAIVVAVLLLAWSAYAYMFPAKPTGWATDTSGQVVNSQQNLQYFQQVAQQTGSECGDVTDVSNVQHLSHHPDRYAECLKKVDSAFLKKATGLTLKEIIG